MSAAKRRKLNEHDDGSDGFSDFSSDEVEDERPSKRPPSDIKQPPKYESPMPAEEAISESQETGPKEKTFKELGIIDSLVEACNELGYKKATPIQVESIPLALQGRDLIGLAETGSGKTAAFALPILQALMEKPQPLFGLVLAPTRELAFQTQQQFSALGSLISVRVVTIVGGMPEMQQAIDLSKQPHIIVATPGRLLWHLTNTKGFSLRTLRYLVLDEADRLLEMSFGDEIDRILKVLPPRHTYLFSATMSGGVESLQRASLRNPARIAISNAHSGSVTAGSDGHGKSRQLQTVKTLVQHWLLLPQKRKDLYLIYLLTGVFAGHSAIIFARTVNEVARLTHLLKALGLGSVVSLHGQMSQSARLSSLSKFKTKRADMLIATDVAARGLDIPSVDLVMNFDLPGDSTTYIHRVGRTARAGLSGRALSFVTQYDVEVWLRIEKALGRQIEQLPTTAQDADAVNVLAERVGEGQRVAVRKLKDEAAKEGRGGGGGGGGGRGARREGARQRPGKGRRGDERDREEALR